jgi:hypothetical protein
MPQNHPKDMDADENALKIFEQSCTGGRRKGPPPAQP